MKSRLPAAVAALALAFAAVVVSGATAAPPATLVELSPAPPAPAAPAGPVALDPDRYRVFTVGDYAGPVTWDVEGESIGWKEAAKPFVLFGRVHGQAEPGEYDVPAGAVVVWGKAPGTTRVTAFGVVDGKARRLLAVTFVVGPTIPPKPLPDKPVVPAPAEPSALVKSLRAAYAQAPDPAALAGVTAAMADAVALCNDGSLVDAGALESRVRAATRARVGGPGKLPAVGKVLAEYLAARLPAEATTPLTAEARAAAATAYAALAAALKELP